MIRRSYKTDTRRINAWSNSPRSLRFFSGAALVGAVLALLVCVRGRGLAQSSDDGSDVLALIAAHARAHPAMRGPIVLTRHERAYDRTTREEGTLALDPTGALVTIGQHADISIRVDAIEAFDGTSGRPVVLTIRDETPLAHYARVVAGEDPATLFATRVLEREASRVTIELLPRAAWLGLERVIVRVRSAGADRGRLERVLWLDGLGNWQRIELERVTYPARLDPSLLAPPPHPGARPVEL